MTRRLVDYIVKTAKHSTFTDIATEIRIDEKTVRNMINELRDKEYKIKFSKRYGKYFLNK